MKIEDIKNLTSQLRFLSEDNIKSLNEKYYFIITISYVFELNSLCSVINNMFNNEPNLWVNYHDARDFSFQGYDNQEEIPINKIIKYLESKSKHTLTILDLGCGRNIISQHFKENKKC